VTTVGITGATGVVGGALLHHLIGAGYDVRALVRNENAAALVARSGASPITGDLSDPASLDELARGCRWMFNVAGVNQMCVSDPTEMERVNVGAVRTVVEACRRGGVERLIHTSSAVTLGERRGSVGAEQSIHRGGFLSEYERTKFLGERLLFESAEGLDVVSVNPSSVQGPGRATGTGRIILDAINGKMPFLIDTHLSIVDIEDCARGHVLAAERGIAGERYVLSAPPITVEAAIDLVEEATGRDMRIRLLPPRLVEAVAGIALPLARIFKRDLPICSEMVRVMSFGHRYDGSRASRELGLDYRPPRETIERLVRWLESENLITPTE
jgi:dihydroflavonol-4-reductase